MKLEIWGSCGGEGFPGFFCNCGHCNAVRKAGGKSIRTLSQAVIDRELIIDLPADTNMHLLMNNFSLGNVENIIVTHAHADHYVPELFSNRGAPYAHNMKYKSVNIYGSDVTEKCFERVFDAYNIREDIRADINLITLTPYKPVRVGKYEITPLPARHAPALNPLNYIISDGSTACLYLLDTGYPVEEIFTFLENYKTRIGCTVMDATMGTLPLGSYIYHMAFADNIKLKEELLARGIADSSAAFVATHFTHNHAGTHEEIEAWYAGSGIIPAYDGFSLTF